jgi:hypothetical protein
LVFFPLAITIAIVALLTLKASKVVWLRTLITFLVALIVFALSVVLRGEFLPWLEAIRWNGVYANALGPGDRAHTFAFHLLSSLTEPVQLVIITAALLGILARVMTKNEVEREERVEVQMLFNVMIATLLVGIGTLSLMGLWGHHALILMTPVVIALILFGYAVAQHVQVSRAPEVILFTLAALSLSGWPGPSSYVTPIIYARANLSAYFTPSPEARAILSTGAPTSYARIGNGDDSAHTTGLNGWKLQCPYFAQFPWESMETLDPTLRCLPSANVILVQGDGQRVAGGSDWNAFMGAVDLLLEREYACRQSFGETVCKRKNSPLPSLS